MEPGGNGTRGSGFHRPGAGHLPPPGRFRFAARYVMRLRPSVCAVLVVLLSAGGSAGGRAGGGQAPPPAAMPTSQVAMPMYQVASAADFAVDGKGSAPAWSRAAWAPLTPRGAPAGGDSPPSGDRPLLTRFKMLYSSTGLYVLMDSEDRTLTATFKDDFLDLWTEDVFEFFLWPDERYPVYFEYRDLAARLRAAYPRAQPRRAVLRMAALAL